MHRDARGGAEDGGRFMRVQVQRLEALTGLRFVAAAAVVFYHLDGFKLNALFGLPPAYVGDFSLGYSGVTFFFVLSGFILAYVYPTLESPAAAGRFLLARFARLWPAHLFGLAVAMALEAKLFWQLPEASFDPLGSLLLHLAMLQSWVPAYHMGFQYNVPSWSVSAEFTFYLLFVPLVRNWGRTWWWKLPLTFALPVGVIAAANAFDWPYVTPPGHASYEFALYFHPLLRVWQFALGMATALLWQRYGRARLGLGLGTLLEAGAVAACFGANYYCGAVSRAVEAAGLGAAAREFVYNSGALVALPFAALIFVEAGQWGLAARLASTRPAVFLGEISFGVYILHWPMLKYAQAHWHEYQTLPGWQALALYWAVLLGLSWWLYAFVEQPARRWLVGLWPKGPAGEFAGWRPALGALARSRTARAAAGTLALVALILVAGLRGARGTFRFVNPERVESFVKFAPYSTRGVRFGDYYLLRGATAHRVPNGIELRAVWECLKTQPPGCKVWLQGLESRAATEGMWTVVGIPPLPPGPIFQGWVWEQRLFIPQKWADDAPEVALIVWDKEEMSFLRVYGPAVDHPFRLRVLPPLPYDPPPGGAGGG